MCVLPEHLDANSSCANLMTTDHCPLLNKCAILQLNISFGIFPNFIFLVVFFFLSFFCLSFVHLIAGNSFCREIVAFWAVILPNYSKHNDHWSFDQFDLDAENMELHVKRKQPTINITNRQSTLILVLFFRLIDTHHHLILIPFRFKNILMNIICIETYGFISF